MNCPLNYKTTTHLAWEGNERGRCKGSVRIDPFPENHTLSHQHQIFLLHHISLPIQQIFEIFTSFFFFQNIVCEGKFPPCWRLFWGFVSTLIRFFSEILCQTFSHNGIGIHIKSEPFQVGGWNTNSIWLQNISKYEYKYYLLCERHWIHSWIDI